MPSHAKIGFVITIILSIQSVHAGNTDAKLWHGNCGVGSISQLDFSRFYPNAGDDDVVESYDFREKECRPCRPGSIESIETYEWWYGPTRFDLNQCQWCATGKISDRIANECIDPPRSRGSAETSYITGTMSSFNREERIEDLVHGYYQPYSQAIVPGAPQHANKPLYLVIQGQDGPIERHGYDSVVVSESKDRLNCTITGCKFNEMFICSNLDRWHSFTASTRTTRWFRNIREDAWNVNIWKSIRTRNFLVEITVRFGEWGSSCSEPGANAMELKLVQGVHLLTSVGSKPPELFYESTTPITCMRLEFPRKQKKWMATCDTRYKTARGWTFLPNQVLGNPPEYHSSILISLPANITMFADTTNALKVTRVEGLRNNDVINECNPYFVDIHQQIGTDIFIVDCVDPRNFDGCQIPGDPRITSSCSNERIYQTCQRESDDDYESCFRNEVQLCQNMQRIPPKPRFDFSCQFYSNVCNSAGDPQGPRFWSHEADKCVPCFGSLLDKALFIDSLPDMQQEISFQCAGAYGGRIQCNKKDHYTILINSVTTQQQTETILTKFSPDRREANARCASCITGPTPPGQYIDLSVPCESSWKRQNIALQPQLTLHSTAIAYKECIRTNCNLIGPAKYAECPAGDCRDCFCQPTCDSRSDPSRDAQESYCLVDVNLCNGYTFNNTGATCMNIDSFTSCPIGRSWSKQHYTREGLSFRTYLSTPESQTNFINHLCPLCVHPGPMIYQENDKEYRFCEDGLFWPGCTSSGLRQVTPCEPCLTKPPNSEWVIRSAEYGIKRIVPECTWECSEGFYNNGTTCVSCTLIPCDIGSFRQSCPRGTIVLPECKACESDNKQQQKYCPVGTHKRFCNGNGYTTGAETKNSCPICRTATQMNCPLNTTFRACEYDYTSDNSECTSCPQYDPGTELNLDGVLAYVGICEFVCKVGYYRQEQIFSPAGSPVKKSYKCVLCPTDPFQYCPLCQAQGCQNQYAVKVCNQNNTVYAPTCECKPGNGRSDRANSGISCTTCDNYMVSSGQDSCRTCPGGYSGATFNGSSACRACPVNTFRPYFKPKPLNFLLNTRGCEPCAAGTNGFTGSKTCITTCSNGLKAVIQDWDGYLWNYQNSSWTYWKGFPPNLCTVKGMGPDMQICGLTGTIQDIKYRKNLMSPTEFDVYSIDVVYTCGECGGGLAFTSNFNYYTAVAKTRTEL